MLFRRFLTTAAAMWRVCFIIQMGRMSITAYAVLRMMGSYCPREILTKGFFSTRHA